MSTNASPESRAGTVSTRLPLGWPIVSRILRPRLRRRRPLAGGVAAARRRRPVSELAVPPVFQLRHFRSRTRADWSPVEPAQIAPAPCCAVPKTGAPGRIPPPATRRAGCRCATWPGHRRRSALRTMMCSPGMGTCPRVGPGRSPGLISCSTREKSDAHGGRPCPAAWVGCPVRPPDLAMLRQPGRASSAFGSE